MLEEEGRKYASNPQTPLGLVKRWLKKLTSLPEEEHNRPRLHPPRTAIVRVARVSLSELDRYPDGVRLAQVRPTERMASALKRACAGRGICYFSEYKTMQSFLNDLSALVHRYEAVALSEKISRLVYASEDAEEEVIETALRWEKNLTALQRQGLTFKELDELFAVATDRLDLKVGLSPGHLTKVSKRTAEYFDPDTDAVYSLGELHRRHGGKLMAKKGEHTYLFWNPPNIPEVWAVAVAQDRRNLLFRRLFHDVIRKRPTSLLKAYNLAERLIHSYSPEYERKKLHELILEREDVLSECLEEIAYGVISAMKSPDERKQIEDFSVGKAGGIASDLLIKTVLGGEDEAGS